MNVPEGWRKEIANNLCSQISVGIVVRPASYYVSEGTGIRAFRSANVREGFVNDSDWVYISEEGHRKNLKSSLKTNDILIVRTGYPGTACLVAPKYEGSNCIDIIFARPHPDRIIPSYLCIFTNSEYGKKQVLDGQGGLAQQHFNVGAFKELKMLLPPLPEQKKIAEILSTWDRAIEVVEGLIQTSQSQKKALMQQLLTAKKRLPGFSGEWEEVKVSDISEIGRGRVISKKEIENNPGIFAVYSSQTSNNGIMGYIGSYDFDGDYITWTTDGIYAGTVFYRSGKFNCTNVCGTISPNPKITDTKYLALALSRLAFRYVSHTLANPKLMNGIMGAIKLKIPPLKEQIAITAILSTADRETEILTQKLNHLKQEKSALMQQLLTGNRRVKIDKEVAS